MSRMPRTRLPLWAAGTTLLLSLAACGAGGYAQTPLSPTPTAAATTSAAPTTAAPTPAASKCNPVPAGFNPLQTYDPLPSLPASGALTGRLAEIRARGYLVAGVAADTLLMGARNPLTGQFCVNSL